jgi:hypothetical protein
MGAELIGAVLFSHNALLMDLMMMMMQRAHVPQFGAWDDGLTYTAVFDEARAAKAGTLINPNDPAENPGLAAILYGRPASAPPPQGSDEPHGRNMANVKDHEKGRYLCVTSCM